MSNDTNLAAPSASSHPLEPLVLQAFAERAYHDSMSLGYFLAGAHVCGGSKAYEVVARDVLNCMEAQGRLTRDELGWWRRTALESAGRDPLV